jgi:hypothetical protein
MFLSVKMYETFKNILCRILKLQEDKGGAKIGCKLSSSSSYLMGQR